MAAGKTTKVFSLLISLLDLREAGGSHKGGGRATYLGSALLFPSHLDGNWQNSAGIVL